MTTAEWLALFNGVRPGVDAFNWMALCPAHPDATPSLSITQKPDRTLMHCLAGCRVEDVVAKLNRTMADLFSGVTVAALAALKKLPVEFLRSLGLYDARGSVLIPYFDAAGRPIVEKKRTALAAKDGSRWPRGKALRAYGEWKLSEARAAEYLLLVEGESDAWCAWNAHIPCLGVPGASAAKTLLAEHLDGIGRVFILKEPDTGGERFVSGVAARLLELDFAGQAFVLKMPDGLKDLADLHAADPEGFVTRYQQLLPEPLDFAATAVVAAADSRPSFLVPNEYDDRDLSRALWDAITAVNTPPSLFRMGDGVAWIEHDDDRRPFTRRLDAPRLGLWLADRIRFYTLNAKDEERPTHPPALVNLLVTPEPPVPVLKGIVSAPGITAEGEIYDQLGYHASARVYYAPADGFRMPPVPATPTPAEIKAATALVLEPFEDFPFVEDADRTHAVAALLTILLRDLIPGPTPLFLFTKPSPGTGASLLVETIIRIATGLPAPTGVEAVDPDEWRKKITATLLKAPTVIFLDNLRTTLDSSALSAALTSETWHDRLLGKNQDVHLPNRAAWLATGNNVVMSNEIVSRVVPVNLDAKVERPRLRVRDGLVTFRHPKLLAWCADERGALIAAGLTLGCAWIAAGRPATAATMGGFEPWADVLGGVLMVAGLSGFLTNVDALYEAADVETDYAKVFLSSWWMRFKERPVTARDLYEGLLTGPGAVTMPLAGTDERGRLTSLGMYLRRQRQRVYDLGEIGGRAVRVLVAPAATSHRTHWRLKPLVKDGVKDGSL